MNETAPVLRVWGTEWEGHKEEGSVFAANREGLREERAFELRLEKGLLVQRTYQLLPRPVGCEQDGLSGREGQRKRNVWEHWRRFMGRVTEGLLTMRGWLDFVLEL